MGMNIPPITTGTGVPTAQERLSQAAIHNANAQAALQKVEALHDQIVRELETLRGHLERAVAT